MLYDNWIHKLSESYTNSNNINEEESGQHHPMVHRAAKFIHSVLDQYHRGHPVEKTLSSITSSLSGKEITPDSVVDASDDAIRDHYGVEGHSYDVNDTVGGDHSEHPDWEGLIDNTVDSVKHHLSYHLDEPEETEKKEVKESTLTESEMILEELKETKEYVNILEGVLNALLEQEVITEEDIVNIMEVQTPNERFHIMMNKTGDSDKAAAAWHKRQIDMHNARYLAYPPNTKDHRDYDAERGGRMGSITAGSNPDGHLGTRAAMGGIQPENAEEILQHAADKALLPPPSTKDIDRLRRLAIQGREHRASRRRKERPMRKKKQG